MFNVATHNVDYVECFHVKLMLNVFFIRIDAPPSFVVVVAQHDENYRSVGWK